MVDAVAVVVVLVMDFDVGAMVGGGGRRQH